MKILGFIMQNKVLTAVIAIFLVGALYFSVAGFGDWNEGAPELNITVSIVNLDANSASVEDFNVGPDVDGKVEPLTLYNADFPAVDPNAHYSVSISIDITPDADGTSQTTINAMGGGGVFQIRLADGTAPIVPDMPVSVGVPNTITFGPYSTIYNGAEYVSILGSDLDSSMFIFNVAISGINADGAYSLGTTEGTITIIEGAQGIINIGVDNIQTNVDGA